MANNTKDEDNTPKTLNDKNHQASSQKFRQLIFSYEVDLVAFFRQGTNTGKRLFSINSPAKTMRIKHVCLSKTLA